MQLSHEEVAAINRLLSWRADATSAGLHVGVELERTRETNPSEAWFVGVKIRRRADAPLEHYKLAFAASLPEAADRVLDQLDRDNVMPLDGAPDTEPHNPRPSSLPPSIAPLTPIEELIA